jgi:hypothetical protein
MDTEWIGLRAASAIFGVRPSTLKAWDAGGLLAEMGVARRDVAGGRRQYRAQDVRRVRAEMTTTALDWDGTPMGGEG